MLSNTQKVWRVILLSLLAIGLVHLLLNRTSTVLIMLIVGGVIFYLYKRPPRWLIRFTYPKSSNGMRPPLRSSTQRKKKKAAKKRYPFRVIDGNKKSATRIKKSQ
ncbi:hypothetical protein [Desmospora activa]|uniref:Uncharacterized protein n=1 Tax=Desmospora activa DSM 45169 TaxID=1121389 RepID=A0A2T4Z9G0_9BACL|nr:hypothetical protein [Desmospora activa]PTM58507.1 hypothetical protein C8J48_1092 [Desmospora activa DSM 45169]